MVEYFKIGQISSAHGVRGEVKVYPLTDNIKRFSKLKTVLMESNGEYKEVAVGTVKYINDFVIIKLAGIETMNDALKLKNQYVYIHRDNAVKLPKDSYFISDLIGMEVFTEESKLLGMLSNVISTGSNDVYEVKGQDGKLILLPAIGEVILEVDVANKKMLVKLLEGLI
jgi:16S rRNA processing protein RimM